MRVAIAGSSGLIGTALRESLLSDGHEVVRLVRRSPASADELAWDPAAGELDPAGLDGLDAVVNLAGAGIGDRRWTREYKRLLLESRVQATSLLATTIAQLDRPPRVFVSASGINAYGDDRDAEVLDEDAEAEDSFLARLCRDWEAAAQPARDADVAVCHTRFGIVVAAEGGALSRMFPLFRFGLGGRLAGGEQYWSFVSLVDAIRAVRFLIEQPGCVGPYNITAPQPVTNAEFTRVLAHSLNRPAVLPVPGIALRLALGEFAETIAGSLYVVPKRLVEAGFEHRHPDARSAVQAAITHESA